MSWSEDRIHRWLARRDPPAILSGSPGHDAAVCTRLGGRPVICADQTLEGVHFESGERAERVGRKAAGRALSDLAATAAVPRQLVLALSAPRERSEAWLRSLIAAVDERARDFGAALVAGDLACVPGGVRVAVTALGEFPGRGRPPGRDRARAGQVLLLSGPVGGSRLGRHLDIEPRIALGRWLYARGATALMDVSDGLALDLWRLARASGVRIDLSLDQLPVHHDAQRSAAQDGRESRWHALHDGEDYELIATVPRARVAAILAAARRRAPGLVRIGEVRPGRGLYLTGSGLVSQARRWRPDDGGWIHGD